MAVNRYRPGRGGQAGTGRMDWRAVADGAVVTVAVTMPATILVRLLKDGDLGGQESNLWFVPLIALLVGSALGGHRAAKRRLDAPLKHAAAAAAAAFAVMAAVRVARALLGGGGITVPLVILMLLLLQITVSLAIIGGYLALRREAAVSRRIDAGSAGEPPATGAG